VKTGRPAGSAEGVSVFRALEAARSPAVRLFSDPYATELLTPGARRAFALCRLPLLGPSLLAVADAFLYGQRAFVLARTSLIDSALEEALARGVEQVLILGAGYDSRAHRIRGIERARVFEVDHPATQASKRTLLDGVVGRLPGHIVFVPVDFNRDSLRDCLETTGFRVGGSCFVIWEGVTEYLDPAAVDATFRLLARTVAPGSEVAFTYLDRRLLDGSRSFRAGARHLAMMRWMAEPFTFGIDPADLGAYLAERGFALLDDAGGEELVRRCFQPRGRRDRPNDYQRIARACVKAS
jgi:methyltransferase (TIGR00027 family)